MNPVFQREMRAQARTPRPWRLRLWVALAAMAGLAWLGWRSPEMFVGSGQPAFLTLNLGAVGVLAVIGPLLTHDRRVGHSSPRTRCSASLASP